MSKYEVELAAARLSLARDQQSLDALSKDAAEAEAQYLTDWQRVDQLLRQIELHPASGLQEKDQQKKSFLGFAKPKIPATPSAELTLLHSERNKVLDRMGVASNTIEKKLRLVASIADRKEKIIKLEACIAAEAEREAERNKQQAERNKQEAERIKQLAIQAQQKQAKEQATRAKAAAHDGSSRSLAAQIKKRIHRQDHCPYCGDRIGLDAHADHIYPVSKGGLSTPKNLVYVCGSCNMRKRDMTLTSFIRQFDLNREEIEERLFKLGKDF